MVRRLIVPALAALACLSAPAVVDSASASAHTPATPTGLHLVRSGTTWIQVAASKSRYATGYRLYASTTRSNVYVANIARAYRSRVYSSPTMAVYRLPRTSRPYYYRVEALNSSRRKFSSVIGAAGLQPTTPFSVQAAGGPAGMSLVWRSYWATSFTVAVASNTAMTTERHDYLVGGSVHRFTAPLLVAGHTYYFRVRAQNYGARSYWSAQGSAVAATAEQSVRIVGYNILKLTSDNQRADGAAEVISPWSQRRSKAAALVNAARPDALAIEEGGYYVDGDPRKGTIRQVDDLVSLTPGYAVAPTEERSPGNLGQVHQTYIVYNTNTYELLGTDTGTCRCGVFELDNPPDRRAVYAVLRNKTTGAQFFFVAVHLANPGSGNATRTAEARLLLAKVAQANTDRLPVVYAGDFNADRRDDAPGAVLKATLDEAVDVAGVKINSTYDSYNQYRHTPPRFSLYLDRIFVSPGVGVRAWGIVLAPGWRGSFVGAIPSDHNPVYSMVTVPYVPTGG